MPIIQSRLANPPVDKNEAKRLALELIRNTYGNIPYPGEPYIDEDIWKVPIIARYPRVLVNEEERVPERVRFMVFENIGDIEINPNDGKIINRPGYWMLQSAIKDELELIQTTVWKALVKVGANNFSNLPLSEHMHTPIEDILSWLLINDTLDLEEHLGILNQEDQNKYLQNVEHLQFVGLIRKTGNIIEPDNAFIEIENKADNISLALANSLAYFFERGYEYIDTIKQVLGPHLIVTGSIYQRSIEYGKNVILRTDSLKGMMIDHYPGQPHKLFKLPRYLVQCVSVGLIDKKVLAGENVWKGKDEILNQIMAEDEIIEPIRQFVSY